jgi:hypothetical protein
MSSSENPRAAGDELELPLGLGVSEEYGDVGAEVLILDPIGLENPVVGETVLLELSDLLPDASGEVVLFTGDDLPVNIVTDQPVAEAGIAEAHVTATGVDVTGLHFYSFESGLTVYSPIDVLIVAESGAT